MAATCKRASSPRAKTASKSSAVPIDLTRNAAVREIIGGGFMDAMELAFKQMEWGEDEIANAQLCHPQHSDRIWHSFKLLAPTHVLMKTEMVYRAHCREILARVLAGEDTRPGTAAECCCACCETSQLAPLNLAGVGLYLRMWQAAGFPEITATGEHHEALAETAIDTHERTLRNKLAVAERRLPTVIEHTSGCPATAQAQQP